MRQNKTSHEEMRLRRLEAERSKWLQQLRANTEIAYAKVEKIFENRGFHPRQLIRYRAGLRAGLYTPEDFTDNRVPCS